MIYHSKFETNSPDNFKQNNMKNIHVLPTDKPSRLHTYKGVLNISASDFVTPNIVKDDLINQNLYITSDEHIGDDEWCILLENHYTNGGVGKYNTKKAVGYGLHGTKFFKKIILTTDQELIADGIQAIDDDFLKWYVYNPSCEGVEVKPYCEKLTCQNDYCKICCQELKYKIIIPKEESKQIYYNTVGVENGIHVIKGQFNTQKEALGLANELNRKFPDLYYDWNETLIKIEPKYPIGGYAPGSYGCTCVTCKTEFMGDKRAVQCEPCAIKMTKQEEPKQSVEKYEKQLEEKYAHEFQEETFEEAAKINCESITHPYCDREKSMFIKGAKWQSERMYSEEEVIQIINMARKICSIDGNINLDDDSLQGNLEGFSMKYTVTEMFEKFKKK